MMKRTWIWIMLMAWGLPSLWAQEFSAFVSKREVPVGEVFKVSFQLRGGRSGNLTPPKLDGFQLRGGPSQESSVQMVNGQVTESMTVSYYLQGTRTGSFKIGSATMEVGDKELRSDPVEVKIVPARSNAPDQGNGNNASGQRQDRDLEAQLKQAIFLRALVSDRSVYQGEPLTVTYKLYERVRTSNLRPESSPSYEGFWVENIDVKNPPPKIEVVDGMQYRTYIVKKDILFPQRPGKLKLEPFKLSCVVQVQVAPRRQRQSIFDSFFGQYENYEYSFASAPVTITAKALPGNPPASYTGVVGKLELQASLDTTSVEAGDPLTLRLRLSGRGNLKRLREPEINLPPDFEVYDPNVKERLSNSGSTLTGWRSYEYLIIPRNPGDYELPPVELSYFDSEKGRYQVLRSPSYQLTVTG
ncbi:MAG: BatD family protein, partial [Bacteroidota bacterium]